jgi:putative solute:sodium symporter small subunit
MTLTLTVTLLAIWVVVSIPVSLMIVRMMQVEPAAADGSAAIGVEAAFRESA